MERLAFKMKLNAGQAEEYKKRHDLLWPELKQLLTSTGVRDYSIFFDEETHLLFGTLKIAHSKSMDKLSENAIMKKWWDYMKDIMATNPDHSPRSVQLKEVFHLS